MKQLPSKSYLETHLSYDQETGVLKPIRSGVSVFRLSNGYFQSYFGGEAYLAHRLIYKMMTGMDPVDEIDHIDGDPSNNKWSNLRPATNAENARNRRRSRRNKSGVKGICWESLRRKWRATIGSDPYGYGLLWCKRFNTLEEAKLAIESKRRELHGEYARNG